ncbi:DNA repair protein RecN [Lentisphaerota bacterium WC36G]|nr:DNA repair protein RecN [Lentisphaerae bacterium WC36]
MINYLQIRNFALIDKTDIEFDSQFNVITGETGAGKSIILGSIALILGERAPKNIIRNGEKRCEVVANIHLQNIAMSCRKNIAAILHSCGIVDFSDEFLGYDELHLKRVVTSSGSRSFINDCAVTLQTLKAVGDLLVDIHGANEHQSLLQQSKQLAILDRFANTEELLGECRNIANELKLLDQRRNELFKNIPSEVEAEHLSMIVEEINSVDPQENEDEELNSQHKIAANSRELLQSTALISNLIEGVDSGEFETKSVLDYFAEIYRELTNISSLDDNSSASSKMLEKSSLIIESIREFSYDIDNYRDKIDIDEEQLNYIEERMSKILTLIRRYGPTLDKVFEARDNALKKLEDFHNFEELKEVLKGDESRLKLKLENQCKKVTSLRQKAAKEFVKLISQKLCVLGFEKGQLSVDFKNIKPSENGADSINFMFSANLGEDLKPLKEIASSGEISRVMLAIKTVLAENDAVPILIFDEVDANIGGETAMQVGKELQNLATTHQVITISHLAQVASHGHRHFYVYKTVDDDSQRSFSYINSLNKAERHDEIARMLGGSSGALQHAKKMINAVTKMGEII